MEVRLAINQKGVIQGGTVVHEVQFHSDSYAKAKIARALLKKDGLEIKDERINSYLTIYCVPEDCDVAWRALGVMINVEVDGSEWHGLTFSEIGDKGKLIAHIASDYLLKRVDHLYRLSEDLDILRKLTKE